MPVVRRRARCRRACRAADRDARSTSCTSSSLTRTAQAIDLDVYRGKPVLVTMFYASCPATCPLIIDTLRAVERKLDDPRSAPTCACCSISIDPERDTPTALRKLADERHIDTSALDAGPRRRRAVRRIAAALEHPVPATAGRRVQSLHHHLGAGGRRKDHGAERGAGPR